MRVAVIGSRTLHIENLKYYLPDDTTEIVSGGAKGVDADAKEYATQNQIPITEFLPDYQRYGRGAPLKRNIQIISSLNKSIHKHNKLNGLSTLHKTPLPLKNGAVFLYGFWSP